MWVCHDPSGLSLFQDGLDHAGLKFEENMKGAKEAGVDIGVYFFSQAVTDAEAEEEASFVLQQIQGYQVTYPIAFDWEFAIKDDGSINEGFPHRQLYWRTDHRFCGCFL